MKIIMSSLKVHMKQSFARPTFRFVVIFQPILYSILFYFMFNDSKNINIGEQIVVGTGIMTLWSSIVFSSAGDIERERYMGTLESISATPSDFRVIFFGKVLGNVFLGIFSMLLSLLSVSFLLGVKVSLVNPFAFIISFLLTLISFSIISMLMAALFTLSRNSRMLMNAVEYPIYILCGLMFPISILPNYIQYISYLLIPTWVVKLLRQSMIGINNYNVFFADFISLVILTLVYTIIGFYLFKKISYKTRVKGDLGVY